MTGVSQVNLPPAIQLASELVLAGVVAQLLVSFAPIAFTVPTSSNSNNSLAILPLVVLCTSVPVFFVLGRIQKRKNWARLAFLALCLLSLPFVAISIIGAWQIEPLLAGLNAIASAPFYVACLLLFLPATNRWFRHEVRLP